MKRDEGAQEEHSIDSQEEVKPAIPVIAIAIGVALTVWGLSTDSFAWSSFALILAFIAYGVGIMYVLRIIAVALTGREPNERQNNALESVAAVIILLPAALFGWGCFEADQQIRKDTDGNRVRYNQMDIYQRIRKHNFLYGWGYKYYYQHSIVGFRSEYAEFEKRMDKAYDLIDR